MVDDLVPYSGKPVENNKKPGDTFEIKNSKNPGLSCLPRLGYAELMRKL